MALKLTRKAGESAILHFQDENKREQNVRLLVRKARPNGTFEISYQSSINIKVITRSGLIQSINAGQNMIISHELHDEIMINAAVGNNYMQILSFGLDEVIKTQLRMWFDAPDDVSIIRDELEYAA